MDEQHLLKAIGQFVDMWRDNNISSQGAVAKITTLVKDFYDRSQGREPE